jgi:cytochrome P450
MLAGAAANRDPRKWGPTADQFIVDRAGANDQVSFGGGPHFCLGAALARLEGQIALPRLMRRFPRLRPTAEPVFEPRMVLRGVGTLPVATV